MRAGGLKKLPDPQRGGVSAGAAPPDGGSWSPPAVHKDPKSAPPPPGTAPPLRAVQQKATYGLPESSCEGQCRGEGSGSPGVLRTSPEIHQRRAPATPRARTGGGFRRVLAGTSSRRGGHPVGSKSSNRRTGSAHRSASPSTASSLPGTSRRTPSRFRREKRGIGRCLAQESLSAAPSQRRPAP